MRAAAAAAAAAVATEEDLFSHVGGRLGSMRDDLSFQ